MLSRLRCISQLRPELNYSGRSGALNFVAAKAQIKPNMSVLLSNRYEVITSPVEPSTTAKAEMLSTEAELNIPSEVTVLLSSR